MICRHCACSLSSAVYTLVPNATARAREALLGGLLTTLAFDGFRAVRMVLAVLYLQRHLRSFGNTAGILTVVVFGLGNRPSRRDFRPLDGLYPSQRKVLSACARHRRNL